MNVSIDWGGCYLEHREFFDAMAISMQRAGHRVGIITGEREHKKPQIEGSLGFKPDFLELWPELADITNGMKWKVDKFNQHAISLHFDDDATDLKKYTSMWIVKVMNSSKVNKF